MPYFETLLTIIAFIEHILLIVVLGIVVVDYLVLQIREDVKPFSFVSGKAQSLNQARSNQLIRLFFVLLLAISALIADYFADILGFSVFFFVFWTVILVMLWTLYGFVNVMEARIRVLFFLLAITFVFHAIFETLWLAYGVEWVIFVIIFLNLIEVLFSYIVVMHVLIRSDKGVVPPW